jgi:hypothetical protein
MHAIPHPSIMQTCITSVRAHVLLSFIRSNCKRSSRLLQMLKQGKLHTPQEGDLSFHIKHTLNCTLVQVMRLCTGSTAYRGSRGIALPFHDHVTRRGWGVSVTPWPIITPRKDLVPLVKETGWAPEPVWTGAENLAPTGIRSPDRPKRTL